MSNFRYRHGYCESIHSNAYTVAPPLWWLMIRNSNPGQHRQTVEKYYFSAHDWERKRTWCLCCQWRPWYKGRRWRWLSYTACPDFKLSNHCLILTWEVRGGVDSNFQVIRDFKPRSIQWGKQLRILLYGLYSLPKWQTNNQKTEPRDEYSPFSSLANITILAIVHACQWAGTLVGLWVGRSIGQSTEVGDVRPNLQRHLSIKCVLY